MRKTLYTILISFLLLLCGSGCDNSPRKNPPQATDDETETWPGNSETDTAEKARNSSSDSKESQKKSGNSDDEKKKNGKVKKSAEGNSHKGSSESGPPTPQSGDKKKNFSSSKEGKQSGTEGEKSNSNVKGTKSGTAPNGSHSEGPTKPVPAGWTSTDIKKTPSASQLEIWNNILIPLRKLIVAQRVIFSSLGASHTSLTVLPENKYKAAGRCVVFEKNGNQIAYEFECTAFANQYTASILSVNFHSPNN